MINFKSKKRFYRPTLFFYYFSKNIIWSSFLIIKEEKAFPQLVFINVENIKTNNISMDIHKNNKISRSKKIIKDLILNFLKIFILEIKLNNTKLIDVYPEKNIKIMNLIKSIFENNLAFEEKSIFKASYTKPSKKEINSLYSSFLIGEKYRSFFLNRKKFIFNGRYAPVYCFTKGLINFDDTEINRIELNFKNNKKHIFSTNELWKCGMVKYVESKYKISKDLSYFEKRRNATSGLDYGGNKIVIKKNPFDTDKFDISLFLSSPYEFVGLQYSSRESMNIFKNAFREIIKFQNLGYSCSIRQHPFFRNSNLLDHKLFNKWFRILKNEGVSIFDFDSNISSYKLIDNTKIIFTIGSSIGGESSFMNKHTFDFNKYSFPHYFKIVDKYDFDEVKQLLENYKNKIKFNKFKLNDFYRFASFYSGCGYRIPRFLL